MTKNNSIIEEEPLLVNGDNNEIDSPTSNSYHRNSSNRSSLDTILGDNLEDVELGLTAGILNSRINNNKSPFDNNNQDPPYSHVHRNLHHHHSKRSSIRTKLIEIKSSLMSQNVGIKLMIIAQPFGTAMGAATRLLETNSDTPFHPSQILFVRMGITYLCCLLYMFYAKIPDPILGPKGVRLLLNLRGLLGFCGVFGFYYALVYLDLSDATVIGFLSPSVTGFLAWCLLGEVFGSIELRGGLVSLFGVIIIARPSFIFDLFSSNPTNDEICNGDDCPSKYRLFGVAMSLVGVLTSGLCFVVIRKIGTRAHPLISVSYFALWCVIVSTFNLFILPGESFAFPQGVREWILLVSLGAFGFVFQFIMTAAIQREKASVVTSINYTAILWALLWERLLWGDVPDVWSFVGGSIILTSAIWMAYSKYKLSKQNEPDEDEDKNEDEDDEYSVELRDRVQVENQEIESRDEQQQPLQQIDQVEEEEESISPSNLMNLGVAEREGGIKSHIGL